MVIVTLSGAACVNQQNRVVVNSENQDTRVRVVVIHHTTANFEESLNILTKDSSRPVSSHYLIPEPNDASYPEKKLKLYSLVKEHDRAWHAGSSYWAGKTALNDISIGIELVNQARCHEALPVESESDEQTPAKICFYPDFAPPQLEILIDLLDGILQRHSEVKATHIVGHSDIAPQRKLDPGPRFPWQQLYKLGFGAWYEDETVIKYWQQQKSQQPDVLTLQTALHDYGYEIELTGEHDVQTRNVVRAFQLHFLPWRVNGEFTPQTVATLYALLEKYYPEKLQRLQQLQTHQTA